MSFQGALVPLPGAWPRHALGRLVYTPSGAARLLRLATVVSGAVLGLASLQLLARYLLSAHVYRKDFLAVYVQVRAIADGSNPYLPIQTLAERYVSHLPVAVYSHPTPHPPTMGILFLPFALLDYVSAATVWLGLELVFLVAAVYLLARTEGLRLSPWGTLALAIPLIAWHPFTEDLYFGQLTVTILLLVAGGRLALLSGRRGLGGVLLGFAVLVKPVTWPLVLLFALRRDWRVLGASATTILVGYLAALWTIGLEHMARYLIQALPAVTDLYRDFVANQSLWSIGRRLFAGTGSVEFFQLLTTQPLARSEFAALVVSVAVPAVSLLVACLAVRKRDLDASLGIMVCLSIVINPIAWTHYLVLATIPAAQVIRWLADRRLPVRETTRALVVMVLLLVSFPQWMLLAQVVAGQGGRPEGAIELPFAPALLTLMPVVAVGALAWLVVTLQDAASPSQAHGDEVDGGRWSRSIV